MSGYVLAGYLITFVILGTYGLYIVKRGNTTVEIKRLGSRIEHALVGNESKEDV